MKHNSVGIVIGRFQVDELTTAHTELLDYVTTHHNNVMILVGIRPIESNKDNPLNFAIRAKMLGFRYPNAWILPLWDKQTNEMWSEEVDHLIWTTFPGHEAILYGGRDSFIPHYKGRHETKEIMISESISGTETRKRISNSLPDTKDFRAGVIYATTHLPPRVVPCVDIAVIQDNNVLLGRKSNEIGWRLPGGRVDVTDENYLAAAKRELFEETGFVDEGGMKFAGTFKVDDWRLRGLSDVRYITSLYVMPYNKGIAKAGDDLCEVKSFDVRKACNLVIAGHLPLIEAVIRYMFNNSL